MRTWAVTLLVLGGVLSGCTRTSRPCVGGPDLVPLSDSGWHLSREGTRTLLLTEGASLVVIDLRPSSTAPLTATLVHGARERPLPLLRTAPLPRGSRGELRVPPRLPGPSALRVSRGARVACWPVEYTPELGEEDDLEEPPELDKTPLERIFELRRSARRHARADRTASSIAERVTWGDLAAEQGYPSLAMLGYTSAAYFQGKSWLWSDARHTLAAARRVEAVDPSPIGAVTRRIVESDLAADEGRLRRALDLARQAETEAERWGQPTLALEAKERRANVLRRLDEPEAAIEVFESTHDDDEALDPARHASFLNSEAYAHIRLLLARGTRDPKAWAIPRALSEQAIREAERAEQPSRIYVALTNLALVAEGRGDDEALREALARLEEIDGYDTGYGQIEALAVKSRLALREGRLEDAKDGFERALETTLRNTGGRASEETWPLRLGLGRTLLAAREKRRATSALDAAMADLETLSLEGAVQGTRARFLHDRREVFEEAARAFLAANEPEAALAAVERARTQLLRSLQLGVRWARLDPAARETARRLSSAYHLSKRELAGRGRARRDVAASALPEFDAATAELAARADRLAGRLAEHLETEAPLPSFALDIPALRRRLPPGGRAVGFWPLGRTPYAFILSPEDLEVRALSSRPGAAAALLLELEGEGPLGVALPPGPERAALLREVGDALWRRRPWVLLPSLAALAAPARPASRPPLVLADSREDLPYARREGRAVAKLYPTASLLVGRAATRAEVLETLSGRSLLHFAGHGLPRPDDPWEAALALGGGARLTVEEILLRAPVIETVVLSGCETGLVEPLAGGYGAGLPEAFLTAGATYVVATTEPIEDAATRPLMVRFHRLAQAHGVVEGLRRTRLAASDAEAEVARTLFVMQGRGPLASRAE